MSEENEDARIELRINRVGILISDAINNICRPLKAAASSTNTITIANTNISTNTHIISTEPPPLAPINKKRKLF